MHNSGLSQFVFRVGTMHGASVIPDHEITRLPIVAVLELGLESEFIQRIEQGISRLVVPVKNMVDPVRVDIKRLAPAQGVGTDHRVVNIGGLVFLFAGAFRDPGLVAPPANYRSGCAYPAELHPAPRSN